jgi:hypothetical protein
MPIEVRRMNAEGKITDQKKLLLKKQTSFSVYCLRFLKHATKDGGICDLANSQLHIGLR